MEVITGIMMTLKFLMTLMQNRRASVAIYYVYFVVILPLDQIDSIKDVKYIKIVIRKKKMSLTPLLDALQLLSCTEKKVQMV